jgi:hypothetical protein
VNVEILVDGDNVSNLRLNGHRVWPMNYVRIGQVSVITFQVDDSGTSRTVSCRWLPYPNDTNYISISDKSPYGKAGSDLMECVVRTGE